MKRYSFIREFEDNDDNGYRQLSPRKRRNWHNPQSRSSARSGTIGSYASITSPFNNVYGSRKDLDQ